LFWLGFIVSILAAIVASQALITGTFQLISQVMNLSYFPKVKLLHTSAIFHGQVYIPLANWLLMIGTIVVTAVYHNVSP
jgi:KUP system potassium uptake protein